MEPVVNDNNDNESQRILANPGEDIEFANLSSIAHLRKGELPRWTHPYMGVNPSPLWSDPEKSADSLQDGLEMRVVFLEFFGSVLDSPGRPFWLHFS